MPLQRGKPVNFQPTGLTDAVDGTNAPPGSMQQLANLIPDSTTHNMWSPRPASISQTVFGGFTTPGFISGLLVVGNTAYGTIASGRNAGNDEPFAFNLLTSTFLTVGGITAANTPTSPSATGDWTPPILAQIGSRIVVTHPGFAGGALKFGWFDVSGFTATITGNTTNTSTVITGNPSLAGIQPGMTITGTGIPANDTVVSTANFTLTESGTTHTNTTLDGLASTTGLAVGQTVVGAPALGIPAGTTIATVGVGSITLSQAATASATASVTFTGATITMLAAATGNNSQEAIAVAGGTTAAPLWGAGDTDRNNLPSVPLGVAQFTGRAYFALGINGIVFSDVLVPCRVSNNPNVQALTTNDGLAVTALGPLMEYSATTGGIVQGLIAFEGASKMQQIQGDQALGNLSMNAMPVATGTLAPLSISPCELGLAFVSPEGLRIISFAGQVSPPVGDHGTGVTVPFIFAVNQSRICLAASSDTIRIATQNGNVAKQPRQEFWFDMTRKIWCGPHTFPPSLIQSWGNSFLIAPQAVTASLWKSDVTTSINSSYTENANPIICVWQTSLLPDNADVAMNSLVDTMLGLALTSNSVIVAALDENGNVLTAEGGTISQSVTITGLGTSTLWGGFNWGQAPWGGTASLYQQRSIDWPAPVVFKQMSVQATTLAGNGLRIGNLYMRYQILGYRIQEPLVA